MSTTTTTTAPPAPAHAVWGTRLLIGNAGIFLGSIMSGLANRVAAVSLADTQGALGIGHDSAAWLQGAYTAAELAAMPVAAWLAMTFSMRRFHAAATFITGLLGLLVPFAPTIPLFFLLRISQGFSAGLLVPLLMTAALRYYPLPLRLYGLSTYSMTAILAPNLAVWLASVWTDRLFNWRFVYWQSPILSAIAIAAVLWGIPQDPLRLERFRQLDWRGVLLGCGGLIMLALGLSQGDRLDWFNSPLITRLLIGGVVSFALFMVNEWFHPLPLFRLQLLARRNLLFGMSTLLVLMSILLSGSALPADHLAEIWGFRSQYIAPVGLWISVPQLLIAPGVAFFLYKKWVDARKVLALGLLLIAVSCFLGSRITTEWMGQNFLLVQAIQAVGQPMAVIPILFLCTSVVQPPEGPFVSAMFNTTRAGGTVIGSSLLGAFLTMREHVHSNVLVDHAGNVRAMTSMRLDSLADGETFTNASWTAQSRVLAEFAEGLHRQAAVLSYADAYLVFGVLALLLIPYVLCMQYIPAPKLK